MKASKIGFKATRGKDGPTHVPGGDRATACPACGKNHHGLCHKCPHHAEVEAGRWTDVEWSKSPCSGCQLSAELSRKGAVHVSIEAAEFDKPLEVEPDQANAIADFLREFLCLSRREQIVIYCRFAHKAGLEQWPLRRVAARFRISEQAVFSIQQRVARRIPAIGAMFGDN